MELDFGELFFRQAPEVQEAQEGHLRYRRWPQAQALQGQERQALLPH